MKNVNLKKMAIIIIVGMIEIFLFGAVLYNEMNINKVEDTHFTYDAETGMTIIVGPDSDKWIRLEDYVDTGLYINWESKTEYGNTFYYEGTIDGEYRFASKEYWDSVQLSRQPEAWFGWVYVGD